MSARHLVQPSKLRQRRRDQSERGARLFIYEPNGSGHRYEYVSQLARAALESHVQPVLLTTSKWSRSPEFAQQLGTILPELDVRTPRFVAGRSSLAIRAILIWRHPVAIPDADRAMIMTAARYLWTVGAPRSRTFALIMRPPWGSPAAATRVRIKARIWTVLSRLRRVDIAALGDCFGKLSQDAPSEVTIVADKPVMHSQVRSHRIVPARQTLLLAGVIDERKAPIEVARAALSGAWDVHVIGGIDPGVLTALRELRSEYPTRVRIHDGYVGNEELDSAIAASTAVSVVLRTAVGSSGILGRALASGKPVLAGAINETVLRAVKEHGAGVVAEQLTVNRIAEALSDLHNDLATFESGASRAMLAVTATSGLGEVVIGLLFR